MSKKDLAARNFKSMRTWLGSAIVATAATLASSPAQAACLGLGLPAPQTLNICKRLVEAVVVAPVTRCGNCSWFWTPQCCVPGSCLVFPECFILEAAGYVVNAGDVYCGSQGINASSFISEVANGTYTTPTQLATGGTNSLLYIFGGANVDILECKAKKLTSQLKGVLGTIASLPGAPAANIYESVDISGVSILNRSYGNASTFLRSNVAAITLGSLVILTDDRYNELVNWSYSWQDFIWGRVSDSAKAALNVLVHELVHVRQYRQVGREAFLNQYLADALIGGYAAIPYETTAYAVGDWARNACTNENSKAMGGLVGCFLD